MVLLQGVRSLSLELESIFPVKLSLCVVLEVYLALRRIDLVIDSNDVSTDVLRERRPVK
jgi:hypothetical protein